MLETILVIEVAALVIAWYIMSQNQMKKPF